MLKSGVRPLGSLAPAVSVWACPKWGWVNEKLAFGRLVDVGSCERGHAGAVYVPAAFPGRIDRDLRDHRLPDRLPDQRRQRARLHCGQIVRQRFRRLTRHTGARSPTDSLAKRAAPLLAFV